MIKFLLAATVSVFALTASIGEVSAKPKQSEQHVVVKKKKKAKKKAVKKVVAPVAAAVAAAPVLLYDDEVPSGFLMNDQIRRSKPETIEQVIEQAEEPVKTTKTKVASTKSTKTKTTTVAVKESPSCWICTNKVVEEAKKWEGKDARRNKQELKSLFAENSVPPIDPTRVPWCAAFANAILNRIGYETTNSLQARSFLAWGQKTWNPSDGDIVVLARGRSKSTGHVGFFQGYETWNGTKYVKVLGGNTDHGVQIGYFPVNRVLGYRTAHA
jgi:uncharacterized protein (TIGR02594 family)